MAYKISDAMRDRLKKAVRDFNRVIDKTSKLYQSGDAAPVLPEKRSVRDILKDTQSYEELRRELRAMNRIKNAKAMDIVSFQGQDMTRWQAKQIRYDIRTANANREKIRDLIGYDRAVDTENLRERRLVDLTNLSPKQLKEYFESLHSETFMSGQQARLKMLKDNYKEAIRKNFTRSKARKLISYINELEDDEFAEAYVNGEIEDTNFVYGPEEMNSRFTATQTSLLNALQSARSKRIT